jgi:hypothetical protein
MKREVLVDRVNCIVVVALNLHGTHDFTFVLRHKQTTKRAYHERFFLSLLLIIYSLCNFRFLCGTTDVKNATQLP